MNATDRLAQAPTVQRARDVLAVTEVLDVHKDVRIRPLEGGASNENFLVEDGGDRFVLRLACSTEHAQRFALDRWDGYEAHQAAAGAGIAPRMRAVALPAGHTVIDFVDGEVMDQDSIRVGRRLELATVALKRVHTAPHTDLGGFDALVEIDRFISIARAENLRLPDDIESLRQLSAEIRDVFGWVDVPPMLCHNDVQLANLIVDAEERMWVIDWEYAGMGNLYFDLAMLVNNAELDRTGIGRVVTVYFGIDRETDRARIELERFRSALREALWSVVAAPVLTTSWDYAAWAERFFASARRIAARVAEQGLLAEAGPQITDKDVFERVMNA